MYHRYFKGTDFTGAFGNKLRTNLHSRFSHTNATDNKLKVLFFGSDNYSIHVFNKLLKNRLLGLNATSNNGDQQSIGTLDVFTIDPGQGNVSDLENHIKKCNKKIGSDIIKCYNTNLHPMKSFDGIGKDGPYDIGILASFGKMIPNQMITRFSLGIVNFHPSLLPAYRGAAPMPHAIIDHRRETGVSAIKLLPDEFDNGPIYLRTIVSDPSPAFTDIETLTKACGIAAGELAIKFISTEFKLRNEGVDSKKYWPSVWTIQDEKHRTKAPLIKPKHRIVKFDEDSSTTIEAKFRAFGSKRRLVLSWQDKEIKILSLRLPNAQDAINLSQLNRIFNEKLKTDFKDVSIGTGIISSDKNTLYVLCKPIDRLSEFGKDTVSTLDENPFYANENYSIVCIESIQVSLRPKPVKIKDFVNGYIMSKKKLITIKL